MTTTALRNPNDHQPYVAQVGPTLAKKWLATMDRNRHLRPSLVRQYAADMAAGRWVYTADPIKFRWDHAMIDGQHRCQAIVLAGVTIPLLVVGGLPTEAQANTDTGARRTAGDALTIDSHADGNILAAAARLAIRIDRGEERRRDLVSQSEILAYVKAHPDLEHAVAVARHYRTDLDLKPSVLAYCAWRLGNVDREALGDFLGGMADRSLPGRDDPRYTLLRRLDRAAKNREFLPASTLVAWVFRTWNAWRTGKVVRSLRHVAYDTVAGQPVPLAIPKPK